jgi:hypothetical protein
VVAGVVGTGLAFLAPGAPAGDEAAARLARTERDLAARLGRLDAAG